MILRGLIIFIIVTVGYLLTTFFTGTYEAYIDGEDKVGFPWVFYTKTGGKLADPNLTSVAYNHTNLFLDILVYTTILLGMVFVLKRKKHKAG